jgi:tetratricopeptide (TPR) repeat protein
MWRTQILLGWLATDVRGGPYRGRLVSQGLRDEAVIRTPDRRLRVFVSSTLGELAEERRAVSRAVSALRLTPVMFEAGARPYPPAEVYRAYLAQADVFIGVYWQRYGQLVPGTGVSGLEEEFDLSGGLPRLLYVKGSALDREPRLADLLARIKEGASASYRHFRTPGELGRLVRNDLAVLLSERFAADGRHPGAAAPAAGGRGPGPLPVSATSLADRQRLAPLLTRIGDPFLHAVSQLAMAWTLPVTGDLDGALREVTVALDELRGQDEPVFTAMAAFTAGSLNTALGRYDDAVRPMREARDLAERAGGDWLAAGSRMQLGILAVLRGRPDEARELLDEALDRSLAAHSTAFVTLCLAGYAQLAFAEGDPERAALLEGAAEGLRRRAGLRVWPTLRHSEDELTAQVRQTLGAQRFDQAFSAGSRLTQRQAVDIVRDQPGTGTQTP